jgi:hypothetical protein
LRWVSLCTPTWISRGWCLLLAQLIPAKLHLLLALKDKAV